VEFALICHVRQDEILLIGLGGFRVATGRLIIFLGFHVLEVLRAEDIHVA
jgi:hypothetical protein